MTRMIALALVACVALPAAATAQTKPKAPSGKYTIKYRGTGSLKVKEKKLTSLSVLPNADDQSTSCGTSTVKLKAVHSLTTVTRAGVTNWIVGKPTPKKADAFQYVKTKILRDGEVTTAKIRVIWNGKSGRVQIEYGTCVLDVDFVK